MSLSPGDPGDTYTDAKFAYDLMATVANSTDQDIDASVTQQVVLYDAAGKVVGGDTGSSDNAPSRLPIGQKYKEQWTGIPAVARAATAEFSVWPS